MFLCELVFLSVDVEEYISKQKSPQKEIILKLRKIILSALSVKSQEMKWGVPVFSKGKIYLVALKDHVNIGFSINGLSKKEMDLFEGKGKTMRHIKVFYLKDIDEKQIIRLTKLVDKKSICSEC